MVMTITSGEDTHPPEVELSDAESNKQALAQMIECQTQIGLTRGTQASRMCAYSQNPYLMLVVAPPLVGWKRRLCFA